MMRRLTTSLSIGLAMMMAGCNSMPRWFSFNTNTEPTTPVPKEVPTSAALVDYMNKNAERLKSLRCTDVRLTISKGALKIQQAQLDGQIVANQPRDFLMRASMFNKVEVELGSNQKEFWYWIRRGDPYQIYCSYDDLEAGRVKKMPFPFEPEWVMETLGMGQYGPPEKYQIVEEPERIKMIERTKTPQGRPVQKVIVFNRRAAKVPTPQVVAYLLLDEQTGKEICSAQIHSAQLDRTTAGMLPEKMTLNWPEHRVQLYMHLANPSANSEVPQAAFVRRPLNGIPSLNMATLRVDGQASSLQRVQGLLQK